MSGVVQRTEDREPLEADTAPEVVWPPSAAGVPLAQWLPEQIDKKREPLPHLQPNDKVDCHRLAWGEHMVPNIQGTRGAHALCPLIRIEQQVIAGEIRHGKEGKPQGRVTGVRKRRCHGKRPGGPASDRRRVKVGVYVSFQRHQRINQGGRTQRRQCHTRPYRPRRHPRHAACLAGR